MLSGTGLSQTTYNLKRLCLNLLTLPSLYIGIIFPLFSVTLPWQPVFGCLSTVTLNPLPLLWDYPAAHFQEWLPLHCLAFIPACIQMQFVCVSLLYQMLHHLPDDITVSPRDFQRDGQHLGQDAVLVSAGIELTVFLVAGTVLCFEFSRRRI